ncbi:hypothetical protein CALCODRAFT_26084 [Calocera cornea HHB12733]|uniref:Uncharacterized protein n=1 Tax=Calocera cornea HHB12733 TaxID=1353952 RepID=A0A165J336_9BASI|nr:hypothetical protein CALCODRAFT_26084 [Calocera cornea HHB12733]
MKARLFALMFPRTTAFPFSRPLPLSPKLPVGSTLPDSTLPLPVRRRGGLFALRPRPRPPPLSTFCPPLGAEVIGFYAPLACPLAWRSLCTATPTNPPLHLLPAAWRGGVWPTSPSLPVGTVVWPDRPAPCAARGGAPRHGYSR